MMQLTVSHINAIKEGIRERYIKSGITNVRELDKHVEDELPGLICEAVNAAVSEYKEQVRKEAAREIIHRINSEEPDIWKILNEMAGY